VNQSSTRGIGFFIASFLAATLVDAPAKFLLNHGMALPEVVFLRYVIALGALLALFATRRQWPEKSRSVKTNLLRGSLLACSTFLNFYAFSQLPLTLVVSINFAAPLISCALAPLLLGEYVGPRRWAAVLVGFLGILVVMQPGSGGFNPAMLACLGNALMMALYQIFTRKAGMKDAPLTGLLWVFAVGSVITTLGLAFSPAGWQPFSLALWPWALAMGTAGLTTHILVSHALRLAPATLLAPFVYTQIIWMTLMGILLFGNWPDHATLLGAAIIIASGIYVWHRERVLGVVHNDVDQALT
jgi:drug/metabolite transporter (DMT)-like permease